jgi:hypothetical protein
MAVSCIVFLLPHIVVFGPLVIIGADLAGVLLIVVLVGVDEVVGSAGSTVDVLALSLLGPCIVVISTLGSGVCNRCTVVLGVVGSSAVCTVSIPAVAVASVASAGIGSIFVGSSSSVR